MEITFSTLIEELEQKIAPAAPHCILVIAGEGAVLDCPDGDELPPPDIIIHGNQVGRP